MAQLGPSEYEKQEEMFSIAMQSLTTLSTEREESQNK